MLSKFCTLSFVTSKCIQPFQIIRGPNSRVVRSNSSQSCFDDHHQPPQSSTFNFSSTFGHNGFYSHSCIRTYSTITTTPTTITTTNEKDNVKVPSNNYIRYIEDLNAKVIVSLRPHGFGKTLFLDMLHQYYDCKNRKTFDDITSDRPDKLFGHLSIGKKPTPLKNEFMVLHLDFSGLDTSTFDVYSKLFEKDFNEKVNLSIEKFKNTYNKTLEISPDNCLTSFERLRSTVCNSKLYILIDEYDACLNDAINNSSSSSPDPEIVDTRSSLSTKITKIQGRLKQFFKRVKSACDKSYTEFNIRKGLDIHPFQPMSRTR
ncbi:hypothetical protein DFA_06140 [Cavenderia fasciculata]|uniref:AAA-ATPase-like domain-containing protein n=1 Tax=Cavenderia fasciculata TaxID=261658 RepID=F4PK78_CACFS|nr:uncharacterized protein DFA_06140 [Cavenderia fasciculata]EGG24002.1 hypothetical protein DFA_06140 [Cavenderia fasciculata]|eukprot:XP_004361853.1 hypothetical protein DFA_06140 [Cavenderia fasciculata]